MAHFTVLRLLAWRLSEREAGVHCVLIPSNLAAVCIYIMLFSYQLSNVYTQKNAGMYIETVTPPFTSKALQIPLQNWLFFFNSIDENHCVNTECLHEVQRLFCTAPNLMLIGQNCHFRQRSQEENSGAQELPLLQASFYGTPGKWPVQGEQKRRNHQQRDPV